MPHTNSPIDIIINPYKSVTVTVPPCQVHIVIYIYILIKILKRYKFRVYVSSRYYSQHHRSVDIIIIIIKYIFNTRSGSRNEKKGNSSNWYNCYHINDKMFVLFVSEIYSFLLLRFIYRHVSRYSVLVPPANHDGKKTAYNMRKVDLWIILVSLLFFFLN